VVRLHARSNNTEVEVNRRYLEFFMNVAQECARMSTCCSRSVGAVLVKDKRIIATGFNGVPAGIPHPKKCVREQFKIKSGQRLELADCIHAEMNCIIQCARLGISCEGSILFCTTQPCVDCTKVILNSGIKKVYYSEPYQLGKEFDFIRKQIEQSNTEFEQFSWSSNHG